LPLPLPPIQYNRCACARRLSCRLGFQIKEHRSIAARPPLEVEQEQAARGHDAMPMGRGLAFAAAAAAAAAASGNGFFASGSRQQQCTTYYAIGLGVLMSVHVLCCACMILHPNVRNEPSRYACFCLKQPTEACFPTLEQCQAACPACNPPPHLQQQQQLVVCFSVFKYCIDERCASS
jgi:hypothetical protein